MTHIDPALFAILAGIVLVLGLIALVPQRDVALAGIGVLGGSVITNYLMATNQDARWSLIATIVAIVLFAYLLFTENILLGFIAAAIGLLGPFLGLIAGWRVDFDVDAKEVPLGWIIVILLIGGVVVASFGRYRRRKPTTVVKTTAP